MSPSAGKWLWKQYATLTRVERANLILAAEEEGDQDELLALENACSEEERHLLNAHLLCLSCAASAKRCARRVGSDCLGISAAIRIADRCAAMAPPGPGADGKCSSVPSI